LMGVHEIAYETKHTQEDNHEQLKRAVDVTKYAH
jgi:hypothetical protein